MSMLVYLASDTPFPAGWPILEECPRDLLYDPEQDVRQQFSLRHIYYLGLGCDEKVLREYLCKHLKPGETAQLYECWACTESEERDKSWDQIVDLQKFIDYGDVEIPATEYAENEEKRFITYFAPASMH